MLNTKVGRYEKEVENMFDYSAERVTRSVEESLARMGLDYIDCIQVRHCVLLVFTRKMMRLIHATVMSFLKGGVPTGFASTPPHRHVFE